MEQSIRPQPLIRPLEPLSRPQLSLELLIRPFEPLIGPFEPLIRSPQPLQLLKPPPHLFPGLHLSPFLDRLSHFLEHRLRDSALAPPFRPLRRA